MNTQCAVRITGSVFYNGFWHENTALDASLNFPNRTEAINWARARIAEINAEAASSGEKIKAESYEIIKPY